MMFINARFTRDSITWRIDCTSFYWVEKGLVQDSTTQIPFPLLSGSVKGPFHTTRSNFEQTFIASDIIFTHKQKTVAYLDSRRRY